MSGADQSLPEGVKLQLRAPLHQRNANNDQNVPIQKGAAAGIECKPRQKGSERRVFHDRFIACRFINSHCRIAARQGLHRRG